jgi:hypothetical protein
VGSHRLSAWATVRPQTEDYIHVSTSEYRIK